MKGKAGSVASIAVAASTFLWYAFLTFRFFPSSQFVKYTSAAQLYAKGELTGERLLDFSPLYLYLTIAVQHMFSAASVVLMWMHTGFISIAAVLLFHILSRRFRPAVSTAGTLAFVLNSGVMIFNQVLEPEPLLVVCLLSFLFFMDDLRTASLFFAGLSFGLAAATRPNYLLVATLVPLYFYVRNRRAWIVSSVRFGLPVAVCVIAILIRNSLVLGTFSPLIMNPGVVAYEGNQPASRGLAVVYPVLIDEMASRYQSVADYQHEVYRMFVSRITGREASIQEVNEYWTRKAVDFVLDYPGRFLRNCATKFFSVFHDYQWHDLPVTYWNGLKLRSSFIPVVPFAFLSALALIGIVLMLRRWREFLLFYGCLAIQVAAMTILYASARQRISLIPILIVFACAAITHGLDSRKRLAWFTVAVLALAYVFHFQTDWMREETHLWNRTRASHHYLGEAYRLREAEEYDEASVFAARSLAAAPWLIDSRRPANLSFAPGGFAQTALKPEQPPDFSSQADRGILLLHANRPKEAAKIFQDLIDGKYGLKRDQYGSSEPYFYLGCATLLAGEELPAVGLLRKGLERSPGDPFLLSYLASLTGESMYRDQLFRYYDEIDASYYLGKAMLATGRPQEAIESFTYVSQKLPEYRAAKVYLAAAAAAAGDVEMAVGSYRDAIRMSPDPVLLEEQIVPAFRMLASLHPEDAFQIYSYGIVLRQYGHYREALEQQQIALRLDPSNSQILSEIHKLQGIIR